MKRRVVHRETESDRYLGTEADVWRGTATDAWIIQIKFIWFLSADNDDLPKDYLRKRLA